MEDIEVVRPLLGEKRRDEGICDGFEGAIGEGEQEHAPVEEIVSIFRGACAEGDDSGEDVAEQGDDH